MILLHIDFIPASSNVQQPHLRHFISGRPELHFGHVRRIRVFVVFDEYQPASETLRYDSRNENILVLVD